MAIIEHIYLGNDNTIDLVLQEAGVAVTLSGVTRVTLDFDGTLVDSAVAGFGSGQPFDCTQGDGRLVLQLGGQAIPAGSYHAVELVVYDAANPLGLVWGTIKIEVH